jgi:hypothetical protein
MEKVTSMAIRIAFWVGMWLLASLISPDPIFGAAGWWREMFIVTAVLAYGMFVAAF